MVRFVLYGCKVQLNGKFQMMRFVICFYNRKFYVSNWIVPGKIEKFVEAIANNQILVFLFKFVLDFVKMYKYLS